jgi:tRNA (mo5U34)-methyltransferase
MTQEEKDWVKEEMDSIKWWHPIKIGEYTTAGMNQETEDTFNNLGLPDDLSGKTVLDIGAWDGYYSFACEKRNAKRVVASDKFVWTNNEISGHWWNADQGFNFAHLFLNSSVEKLLASVEELNPEEHGKFDIVLMLGVIYHAKDPIGYLQKAFDMSNDLVIIETHVDLMELEYPAARYYIGNELNNDKTNYWGPNALAVKGIMKDIGYKNITEKQLKTGRMIFTGKVK